jgi:hypothetical protein
MSQEKTVVGINSEDMQDVIRMNLEISDHLLQLALSESVEISPAADALIRSARRYVSDIQNLMSQK